MDIQVATQILDFVTEPEHVLSLLGIFSIVAKVTPWTWDDDIEDRFKDRPEFFKNGLKKITKLINLIGLTKKIKD